MALNKKRGRTQHQQFFVEGIREIQVALESGLVPTEILYNSKWDVDQLTQFRGQLPQTQEYLLTDEVFEKISYRGSVANALACFRLFNTSLDQLNLKQSALVLVLEAIEKPGNMGAIFRTADAAGVDAILIANPNTDFYNPNVIRASLGTVFSVPFAIGTNEACLDFLKENNFQIYSTYLEASTPHYSVDMKGDTALVLGSEAFGISPFWIEHAHETIKIPMHGLADSMNVSTATAVTVFEAVRQRAEI